MDRQLDPQRILARRVSQSLGTRTMQGFPIRREFTFNNDKGTTSPMTTLLRTSKGSGGRGGRVRLLLYLATLWIAGSSTSNELGGAATKRVPTFWAELLGLDNPTQSGARSIRTAREALIDRGFFLPHTDPRVFQLAMEDGSQKNYSIPTGKDGKGYFRVPESFFTLGLCKTLEAPGISIYLAALSVVRLEEGKQKDPLIFRPSSTKSTFGIADLTRKKGIKELIDQDVLIDVTNPKERFTSQYGYEGQPRNVSKSLYVNPVYLPLPAPGERQV